MEDTKETISCHVPVLFFPMYIYWKPHVVIVLTNNRAHGNKFLIGSVLKKFILGGLLEMLLDQYHR